MLLANNTQLLEGPETAGIRRLLNVLLVGAKPRLALMCLRARHCLYWHLLNMLLVQHCQCSCVAQTSCDCLTPAVLSRIIVSLFPLLDCLVQHPTPLFHLGKVNNIHSTELFFIHLCFLFIIFSFFMARLHYIF